MPETINPFESKYLVASLVSDTRLVINCGRNDGVKKGDRFLVYKIGPEIFDPASGRSLGRLEEVKGIGTAFHVQESMTTIRAEKIVKKKRPSLAASVGLIAYSRAMENMGETTDETIEVPFDAPEVGDFVKKL